MQVHTPSEHVLVKSGFSLAITAAVVNGTAVDTKGWTRALAIFYSAPTGGGTTSDCKVEEDDNVGFSSGADVAGADFAQATTAGGAKIQVMNIDLENGNREQFLRLVHTGVGASAAGQAYGLIVLFRGRRIAPSQDEAVVSV